MPSTSWSGWVQWSPARMATAESFYVYNTREEVDRLVEAIDDARQLFA